MPSTMTFLLAALESNALHSQQKTTRSKVRAVGAPELSLEGRTWQRRGVAWAFGVAQICNLSYRRFAIGKAWNSSSVFVVVDSLLNPILRYSRLQICVTIPHSAPTVDGVSTLGFKVTDNFHILDGMASVLHGCIHF